MRFTTSKKKKNFRKHVSHFIFLSSFRSRRKMPTKPIPRYRWRMVWPMSGMMPDQAEVKRTMAAKISVALCRPLDRPTLPLMHQQILPHRHSDAPSSNPCIPVALVLRLDPLPVLTHPLLPGPLLVMSTDHLLLPLLLPRE